MEALYSRERYGETLAQQIESLGATAVAIANRWSLGWPERVLRLIASGQLMPQLLVQMNRELDVFAEETGLKHLSQIEVLQMHGVTLEAPDLS